MADLSLDEFIAKKKGGAGFKTPFMNQNPRKSFQGKPGQRSSFRQGFTVGKPPRTGAIQLKRPFVGSTSQNNGAKALQGPGKGQIDARDMISIKSRIKITDARTKITQNKFRKQGTFDARTKLQQGGQSGVNLNPNKGLIRSGGGPQQNVNFPPHQNIALQQQGQLTRPTRPQKFQPPAQPLFSVQLVTSAFQQQQAQFPQQGPGFNQQQRPPFNQSVSQFNQQPQIINRPPAVLQQPPPSFQQPRPQFNQRGVSFSQPSLPFQQVPDQADCGELVNFTVAVNSGQPAASQPMAPLTRTLVNPLASGGALVEDTGSSLKITRSVPDVTFDGQNLTVTRRLPQQKQSVPPAFNSGSGPAVLTGSSRGPVFQIQNNKYQPALVQAPVVNVSRARSAPLYTMPPPQRRQRPPSPVRAQRPPSPIRAPVPKRPPPKPAPAPTPAPAQPAPALSASYASSPKYKSVKTVPSPVTAPHRQPPAPLPQSRLRAPPTAPPKRPAQSAFSRMQLEEERVPMSARLSQPTVSATKRLAPHPSSIRSAPPRVSAASVSDKAAIKRRAPMSLSDRFSSPKAGNPIPVITDHAPPKKLRLPEPEPEPVLVEEYEMKEMFEGEEDVAGVPMLSPLQGFRIQVSNLHTTVTQDDIIELFGAIGPLKRANVVGRGLAEVAFIHKEHAVMALKKYHNRELDGQPMFVKLTTPLNAKVMDTAGFDGAAPGLPASLRTSKKPPAPNSAPVEIPLIHKALFKTGADTGPSKSVRFTVKL